MKALSPHRGPHPGTANSVGSILNGSSPPSFTSTEVRRRRDKLHLKRPARFISAGTAARFTLPSPAENSAVHAEMTTAVLQTKGNRIFTPTAVIISLAVLRIVRNTPGRSLLRPSTPSGEADAIKAPTAAHAIRASCCPILCVLILAWRMGCP